MRKTESAKTRIILLSILDDLKENILNKNTSEVNTSIKKLKKEYKYYEKLKD